jgi:hypothetical protein
MIYNLLRTEGYLGNVGSYLNRVLQQPQQQTYYLLLEGDVPIFVEKGAAGIFGL